MNRKSSEKQIQAYQTKALSARAEREGSCALPVAVILGGIAAIAGLTLAGPLGYSEIGHVPTSQKLGTIAVVDGSALPIANGAITHSGDVRISVQIPGGYSPSMACTLDGLPIYCGSGFVAQSGLSHGEHLFTITGPGSMGSEVFHWIVS